MAIILDGLRLSQKIEDGLKEKISKLEEKPRLAIVQVGDRKESDAYIGRKVKYAQKIGVEVDHLKLPEDSTQENLERKIIELNRDHNIHGIIIQIPVPEHINFSKLIEIIDPQKDVDGLGSKNTKGLWQNDKESIMPATVRGVIELLEEYNISVAGKKVVIINRSILVGRPLTIAMLNRDANVSVCHSKISEDNIKKETQSADIVVTAVGKSKMFSREFFREGQTVIDVGISFGSDKILEEIQKPKLSGDVDFENVKDIVYAISPVPGGIGPMTVACLFKNLTEACHLQSRLRGN